MYTEVHLIFLFKNNNKQPRESFILRNVHGPSVLIVLFVTILIIEWKI